MAEHVFRAQVAEAGLSALVEVDSAGTGGWHEGEGADPRTVSVLAAAGYTCAHTARQFRTDWFARLDLVIALDSGHLSRLRRLAPSPADTRKVRLLRSYDPAVGADGRVVPDACDIPDPYYGGMDDFDACLDMVEAAGEGLLVAVHEAVRGRAA